YFVIAVVDFFCFCHVLPTSYSVTTYANIPLLIFETIGSTPAARIAPGKNFRGISLAAESTPTADENAWLTGAWWHLCPLGTRELVDATGLDWRENR
ncbi:MAG: hypothetical protein ACLFS8_06915, partial [Clostridia bacterium]